MRIGIDMRMAGTGEGIGRYVEELVKHLALLDKTNVYLLLYNGEFPISNFQFSNNFEFKKVRSKYYSWGEQTKFIWELKRLKLDLVHFPSFNAPIFYPGKFVVTIHDIIHHLYPGKKKTRFFHRLAYRATIWNTIKRATKIIAVSESTRQDLLKTFKIAAQKVRVIYEGVDKKFFVPLSPEQILEAKNRYKTTKPYLLSVGVWRQYKNLPRLARAFDILRERYGHDLQLVLAGKIDPFYPEIREAMFASKYALDIKALGFVPDEDLLALYQGAQAFVLPSLVEGFGLIGVEAQATEIPIAASGIPVLREVLGEGAVYFDPENPNDIADKINQIVMNQSLTNELRAKGKVNAKKYDWRQTAHKTLMVYNSLE